MRQGALSISSVAVVVAMAGTTRSVMAGSPFPVIFNLSSLNGTNGFRINGIDANDFSGRAVCGVGDINGDGIGDLLLGAPYAAGGGDAGAGESYVVFGKNTATAGPFASSINLSALNGTTGFMITGLDPNDFSGIAVGRAGDINGDGVDDLIIGASSADPNGQNSAGEAYVVFGKKTSVAGPFPATFPLTSLNGTNGFVMNGIDPDDRAGRAVSGAGDVNGDGVDDVVIGALEGDPGGLSNAGEAYVVFGKKVSVAGPFATSLNLSSLNGSNGFAVVGNDPGAVLGCAVSRAGDVDGDGLDDVAIGAAGTNTFYDVDAGRVHIVFGRNTATEGPFPASVDLLNQAVRKTIVDGGFAGQRIGTSVAGADDINGDGFNDLVIGTPYGKYNSSFTGQAFAVFSGGYGFGGSVESLDGLNGFTVFSSVELDSAGNSVSACDLNGDGVSDVIVGAPGADPAGRSAAGKTYVIFGRHTDAAGSFSQSAFPYLLVPDRWFQIAGVDPDDLSGGSVSSAGDVNGDGIDDVIIGARSADPNGQSSAGESYVVFGQPNQVWIGPGGGTWETPAKWLSEVAPVNGVVVVTPQIGVTITLPTDVLHLRKLTVNATSGRTTLNLQASTFLSVDDDFTIGTSGAIGGNGTVVVESVMRNFGLIDSDALTLVAGNGLSNSGLIDVSPASPLGPAATLDLFGTVTNASAGDILMRFGPADLGAWDGLTNLGHIDIVMADATIFGDVTNTNGIDIADAYALFTDDIVNSGAITLDDDSVMTVLGTLTGNGVLGVSGPGTGGDVFVGGGVRPGGAGQSAGIARFDGDLDLGGTAVSVLEIGGTAPGTGHDQIVVAGVLNAGGTLQITTINGFIPAAPSQFRVLQFGSVAGSFDEIVLGPLLLAKQADTSTLLIDGFIRIPAPGCPGDITGDGFVNTADFNVLAGNFGGGPGATRAQGDLSGDGFVNTADFNILAGDFGCGS